GAAWLGQTEWVDTVQKCHRPIGMALATAWGLPDVVAATIRDCNEYDAADRVSAGNLVRFANAVVKREGIYVGGFDVEDVGALVLIGRSLLGLEEDVVARLARGLRERVRGQAA